MHYKQQCRAQALISGTVGMQVFAAVVRHLDWGIVRCLVIAGPGFTKDQFRKYLDEEAVRRDVRCTVSSCMELPGVCWHMHALHCGISLSVEVR